MADVGRPSGHPIVFLTRSNSAVLFVTSVTPSARAWAVMTPYRALLNEESEEELKLDAGLVYTSAHFVSIHERWI